MTTITLKGFIHAHVKQKWEDPSAPHNFAFFSFDATASGFLMVAPYEFEYTLPAGWNCVAAEVSMLEAERDRIAAEVQQKLMVISKRIAELQCITNDVRPLDQPARGQEAA